MKITLRSPNEPDTYKTEIVTEHNITIDDAFVGPIFRNRDGACLAVFARDDGWEFNCWVGDADHHGALPADAVSGSIGPDGVVTTIPSNRS